jgi:hypothetical protein
MGAQPKVVGKKPRSRDIAAASLFASLPGVLAALAIAKELAKQPGFAAADFEVKAPPESTDGSMLL